MSGEEMRLQKGGKLKYSERKRGWLGDGCADTFPVLYIYNDFNLLFIRS